MIYTFIFPEVENIGFWPLNDKYQGSDISVNHNNAILSNTNYTNGPFSAGRRAYLFGQTGDSYIRVPQSTALTFNSSFTFLIYASPNKGTGPIIEYYVGADAFGLMLWFHHAWNKLYVYMDGDSHMTLPIDVRERDWYFLGFSYDVTTGVVSAWMDGEMIGNRTSTQPDLKAITSGDIYLGLRKRYTKYWREGRVACLMIYNSVLSRGQVAMAKQQCSQTFYGELFSLL